MGLLTGCTELGVEVAAALASRPADEDPWTALRGALQVCVDNLQEGPAGLRRARMLATTPSLRTALHDKHLRWAEMLVPHTEKRLGASARDRELQAQALVSSALSCLDVAAIAWTRQEDSRSLDDFVDAAFAALRPGR